MTLPLRRQTKRSRAHGQGATCYCHRRRNVRQPRTASDQPAPTRGSDRLERGLVRSPSISGRATSRLHRRHDVQPQRGQVRRQDRDLEDEGPRFLAERRSAPSSRGRSSPPGRRRRIPRRASPPDRRLLRGTRRRPGARWAESRVETQRGVTIAGRRSTRATIVSNAALPRPTTIAARNVVTGTDVEARRSPSRDGCVGEARDRRSRRQAHRGRRAVSHRRSPPRSAVVSAARRSSSSKSELPREWTR